MKRFAVLWLALSLFGIVVVRMSVGAPLGVQDTIKSIRGGHPKTNSKPSKGAPKKSSSRRPPRRTATRSTPVHHTASGPKPAPPSNPPIISARSMGMLWQLSRGANVAEVTEDGIHLAQRDSRDTSAYASAYAPLGHSETSIWKVNFTAQFGSLESTGTRILIKSSGSPVAQISADGLQNGIIAFVGGADQRYARKFDAQAHRFEIIGTTTRASLWMDGAQIGEGPAPGKPDTISTGPVTPSPGRQTEIWVREVAVQPNGASQGMVDLFNGRDLTGWFLGRPPWNVEEGILKSVGGAEPDCVMFGTQIPSDEFVLTMRLRVLDGRRLRVFVSREPVLLAHLAGCYFGNEGDNQTIALFGKDMAGVKSRSGAIYNYKEWYDFRLEVDADDNVALLQNGQLTFSARRSSRKPVWLAICAGDGFSAGHVEIASVRISANISKTNRTTLLQPVE